MPTGGTVPSDGVELWVSSGMRKGDRLSTLVVCCESFQVLRHVGAG